MNYTISAVMRITVIAVILLGLFFFALRGLLSVARELIASHQHRLPAPSGSHSRTPDSMVPQARLQLERR